MSLINQMLRDLETRRADSSEKLSLPNEVRPLPAELAGQRWLKPLAVMTGAIAALAALGWGIVEFAAKPSDTAASPSAPPVPAVHHEPVLKLDADITEAHIHPATTIRPASATSPPSLPAANRRENLTGTAATLPHEAPETAKAQVEKRAPTTDNNGSPAQRAREQLNAGQRDAAEATLKQALAATPAHVAARQMLFGLMMEQRRSDEALALLKEGLTILPEQTQWASNTARLQMDRDDAAGAWETLQHSLPSAASQGEYRAFCGTVLSRLKRYGEAVGHYQAALRTNPMDGRWWVGMALALEADGKQPESREAFARAQATGRLPPELAAYVESRLKQ